MKKLMFAATVAAAMAGFAVESNIVGYQNFLTFDNSGYSLVGAQFRGVAGTTKTYSLQDIKPANGCTGPYYEDWDQGDGSTVAPQIMVRNTSGIYTFYYYIADAYEDGDGEWQPGWVDSGAYFLDDTTIALGEGFWLYDIYNATPTWTIAGGVIDKDVDGTYPTDYTLTANPFPMDLLINDKTKVDWGNLTGPYYEDWDQGDGSTVAPQIMVRNSSGIYSFLYYIADAYEDGDGEWQPGWVDSGAYYYNDSKVDCGQGFWVFNPNEETVEMTYKK